MNDSSSSQLLLFDDIRSSESSYLKELSELIACCKYNASRVSNVLQLDIAINNNLKNITSSLLSSHLFLNQSILTLEDSDPLLLVNFVNWLSEAAPLYQQYINFYRFDPDQPEKEVHLKRRPLVRIRHFTKFLKRMLDLDVNTGLKQNISEFLEQFVQELSNARDKDDQERQKVATNSISFNDVKCLETMTPTAANFKISDILLRDEFQMSLQHPQRIAKWDSKVELFALAESRGNNYKESMIPRSVAICSVEKLGRSLMFPPFRFDELKMLSRNQYETEMEDLSIALIPYYSDSTNPDIILTLKMLKNINRFDEWIKIFTDLFSSNSGPDLTGEFTNKFNKLKSLQDGNEGLDIRLLPLPQLTSSVAPRSSNLRKSKRLDPTSVVSPDLKLLRDSLKCEEESYVLESHNDTSLSTTNERKPLSDKTNLSTPLPASNKAPVHAFRSIMKGNYPSIQNSGQSFPERPLEMKKEAISPLINMKQTLLKSAAFSEFNKIVIHNPDITTNTAPLQKSPRLSELQSRLKTSSVVTSSPTNHDLRDDITGSMLQEIKPEPLMIPQNDTGKTTHNRDADNSSAELASTTSESMSFDNGGKASILDLDIMANTDLQFNHPDKLSRRKSIFSVFSLKKKSTKKVEKRELLNPQNNCSSTTLTTQETIVASKSNKNINKLTVDTSFNMKNGYPLESDDSSIKQTQTSVSTPASALPSPFSAPLVESPTVELSDDLKIKFGNSRSLCAYNCRVSRWSENKWEIIGGKELLVKVIVNEDSGFIVGCDPLEDQRILIVLPILSSTTIRRSTALDIQLKTKESPSATRLTSTLLRFSVGTQAETLMKALEICKQDMGRPQLNTKDSVTSLQSSMFSSSLSSQSLLSKNAFNSMTSITNNNSLADDILSLGRPKVGAGASVLSPSSRSQFSPTDLYFTPPSSAVDLSLSSSSTGSPHSIQPRLLLLLLSMRIRVHEKVSTKWEPKCISTLELFALDSVPDLYQLSIHEASVDHSVTSDNVLRVGKAGVLLSLEHEAEEESIEYMLEFKNRKLADDFYDIVGSTTSA